MIVKLKKKNKNYPDLTIAQPYVVIGIEADDFRIINNYGRPYLYPHDIFKIEDEHEPSDWVNEFGEDGERYAYHPLLNRAGFFEDFFNGDENAVAEFWRVLNQQLAIAG
ncbi:hypothetical protein H8E88_11380 [candidate division KSB1 bacterium]|nr:hypothetical protein [candidate division KSB1 bacterium]MBL7093636.1 hypothetical protein [candidate division KSB1 bacterium]